MAKMKLKFWKKEKPEVKKEKKYRCTLNIYLDRRVFILEYLSFSNASIKSHNEKYSNYKDFIKWYHCRPQSTSMSFYYNKGVTVIERKHITGYNITSSEY